MSRPSTLSALSALSALTLVLAACAGGPAPTDASLDAVTPLDEETPPADAPRPDVVAPARRELAPSRRALSDLAGFALTGRELPLGTSPVAVARRRWALAQMRAIGVHRVRIEFFWRDIEPAQGTFVWANYDALVNESREAGVELLPVLAYGNVWASSQPGATSFFAPDDPRTFARYARAVAERYGDRLHDWEVWNEPNPGFRFWLPTATGDPVAFGALVLETHRAVLEVRPDARVAYGGTVFLSQFIPSGVDFTRRSLERTPGLAAALRAVAVHAYPLYPPRVSPESDAPMELPHTEKIARMAGMLAQSGVAPDAPLWITEMGWPVTRVVTETLQARWIVRSVLLSGLAGADGVWLYQLGDGPDAANDLVPEQSFGVMRYDADPTDATPAQPKPSHTALTTLFATMGALRVTARERPAGAPDDAHVLRLEGPGSARAYAAWRANDGAEPWQWVAPAAGTVVRMLGERSTVAAGARVAVDGSPCYLLAGP